MMWIVVVSLMYSPAASTPGMRPGLSGVNRSWTLSSYSRDTPSLEVKRRIFVMFVKVIGASGWKSVLPEEIN